MRRRVLILDFDFHTSVGGGQVFYRRVVERNPAVDFYYPSSGPDLRLLASGRLPTNAFPFAFDARLDVTRSGLGAHWLDQHYLLQVSCIAASVQGMTFHAVDIPSFFPAAHIARSVLTAYGVQAERIVLGLVGWQTVSVKNGYAEASTDTVSALERAERLSVESADGRYTISNLEQAENGWITLPIQLVNMQDAIECFGPPDPEPPGEGPPDLWYVGRLDGAKGPDLFIELVARMPRSLYRRCYLTGPDNTWSPTDRWSEHLLGLARSKGVDAVYEGVLSDAEVRQRVYRGRTVVVVPSRTDAFNYVSLEAVLNACPLLLSRRTGALGFLQKQYPHLAPPEMDPDDPDAAVATLQSLLVNYDGVARQLRQTLLARPFPAPRHGFMDPVYDGASVRSAEAQEQIAHVTGELRNHIPLLTDAAMDWRAERAPSPRPRVTVIIPTLDRPALLAATLASLTRQTLRSFEVLVIDDGGADAITVRAVADSFAPLVRYVRIGNSGEAGAVNRGLALARGEYVAFLSDDDAWAPELLDEAVAALDKAPELIGAYPDWDIVDTSGYFVEAHRLPEYDRRLMLCAHWCLPGPGVVIRRKVVDTIGGRDLSFRFVSDFDLWLRATALGEMIHLPRKLAYWRLHTSNLTTSDRRLQMAAERIRLIDRFYMDADERVRSASFRHTAYAAAHLAAAAILGNAEADEAMRHLNAAEQLDPRLLSNLPPNMSGYPDVWPRGYRVARNA